MATNTSDFFTFSKTAGTAKNLQKPTDGGDNNLWGQFINVDLDTIVGAVNATSDLIADANQNELVDFTATGSAVNHVGITNATTGNGPTIEAKGDDTNIDLNVSGKGTGKLATTSPKITTGINDSNNNELIKVTATGSAVNEITVANAATGSGPTLSATGDDTNIDLNIAGKGTGDPKMVDLKVTNIKANDGTAGISISDSTGRLTVTETNPSITLGSNATFPGKSANSGNTIAAGHILQCQFKKKTDTFSNTGQGGFTPYPVTGLDCKITPTDVNSRIIIIYHVFMGNSDSINYAFYHGLYKSATGITNAYVGTGSNNSSGGFNFYYPAVSAPFQGGSTVINMDTAGTTNEITYQVYVGANQAASTVFVNMRGADATSPAVLGTSEVICMEVSNG